MNFLQAVSLLEASILQKWWVFTSSTLQDTPWYVAVLLKQGFVGFISVLSDLSDLEKL